MNRRNLYFAAAALILFIAAGFFVKVWLSRSSDRGPDHPGDFNNTGRLSERASSGSSRQRISPEDAADRLRQLIGVGPEGAPAFEDVEKMVARLRDQDLETLRDESAGARPDSPGAWVRCAVHAELARRDPHAALEWLASSPDLSDYDGWGYRQIWFSLFRGWAGVDPAAALAELRKFVPGGDQSGRVILPEEIGDHDDYLYFIRRDDIWRLQAMEEVFAQYARLDPEAVWAAVPKSDDINGFRDAAIGGLLRGVKDEDDILDFVKKSGAGRHAVELRIFALEPTEIGDVRVLEPDARPDRSSITAEAALALESARAGEGWSWLEGNVSGGINEEQEARAHFFDAFAREYPERVLAALDESSDSKAMLLEAFLRHHPDRAAEGFALVDGQAERSRAILQAAYTSAYLQVEDLFPAPGRSNRLADWPERYHDLLGAVDAGGFDSSEKEELHRFVQKEFAPVVEEAASEGGN